MIIALTCAAFIAIYAIFSFLEARLYTVYDAKLVHDFITENKEELLNTISENLSKDLYDFITNQLEITFVEGETVVGKKEVNETGKENSKKS